MDQKIPRPDEATAGWNRAFDGRIEAPYFPARNKEKGRPDGRPFLEETSREAD
jgi:hypothetical protein